MRTPKKRYGGARAYPDLRTWRQAQALTTHEAARLFDISQSTYSRLERRRTTATGELAKRLMATAGVPLETLVGVA